MKRKIKRIFKAIALSALMSVTAGFSLAQADEGDQSLENKEKYILGTFFKSNEDITMQCYLSESENGDDLKFFREVKAIAGRDISCQFYNGYFYICLIEPQIDKNPNKASTFKLYRSKNLTEWEVVSFNVIDRADDSDKENKFIWAPDLFINDEDNDKGESSAYVYFAKQKGLINKPYEALFNLYVCKINKISEINDKFVKINTSEEAIKSAGIDGTGRVDIPIDNDKPVQVIDNIKARWVLDAPLNEGTNYIDAQVRKVNGKYYMVIKNEARITNNDNKSPLLFRADSPDGNFERVQNWPLEGIRGYEGFSILTRNGKVYFYADNFSGKYDASSNYEGVVGNSGYTVWIADEANVESGPYKAHYVNAEGYSLRHGSMINNLNDEAIKILGIKKFFDEKQRAESSNTDRDYQSENTNIREVILNKEDFGTSDKDKKIIRIENFAPAPKVIYVIPSKKEVVINNIVNAYGVKEIQFKFNSKSKLKIGQEYINSDKITIDDYGNLIKSSENVDKPDENVNEADE